MVLLTLSEAPEIDPVTLIKHILVRSLSSYPYTKLVSIIGSDSVKILEIPVQPKNWLLDFDVYSANA